MFCSVQEESDDSGEDEAPEDSMCTYLPFVISDFFFFLYYLIFLFCFWQWTSYVIFSLETWALVPQTRFLMS